MTILTINIWGVPIISAIPKQRIEKVIDRILQINPDIIAIQEAITNNIAKSVKDKLETNGYSVFLSLRNKLLFNDTGLLTAIKRSKIESIGFSARSFLKQCVLFTMQMGDNLLGKGYMHLNLIEKASSRPFSLYNVHTVCADFNPKDARQKKVLDEQLSELKRIVSADKSENIVLTGDFNTTAEYAQKYLELNSFYDPLAEKNPSTISPINTHRVNLPTHYYRNMDVRYDLTLFSHKIKCINQEILFTEHINVNNTNMNYSDHYAVYSEFNL